MSAVVVGLTGQSGAGKTTVCRIFEDNGFAVINADTVAREVMKRGSACLEKTAELFEGILTPEKELDRRKLAEIVFSDKEKLTRYEAVIYPYITERIKNYINEYEYNEEKFILLDAPTLFESGADGMCDVIVTVTADESLRLSRIIMRDGISEELARKRISSQQSDEFYTDRSDYVITNHGTISELEKEAERTAHLIKERFNA